MITNGYSIASYSDMETRNGIAYRYHLTRNNKKVAEIHNDGRGAMTFITFTSPEEQDRFLTFTYEHAPDQIVHNKDEMLARMADLISYVVLTPVGCMKQCKLTTFAECDWQRFYDLMFGEEG